MLTLDFLYYSDRTIKVKRCSNVHCAKLYYLCGLTGKAARIKEKLPARKAV